MRRRLHNPRPRSIALNNSSLFIPRIAQQLSHFMPVLDIQQISYDYNLGYGCYGCDFKLENSPRGAYSLTK
jgi:hypothetical protein